MSPPSNRAARVIFRALGGFGLQRYFYGPVVHECYVAHVTSQQHLFKLLLVNIDGRVAAVEVVAKMNSTNPPSTKSCMLGRALTVVCTR